MRVLLDVSAVPARPVGAGVYTVAIAHELALHPAGVELVLLARHGDLARWHDVAPGAEIHALVPQARPARLAWEQARGPQLAARLGVDVWHGPHYTVPLRVRCAKVATIHDLTFFDQPQVHERAKVAFFRRAIRASVHHADRLICVSEHTESRLDALFREHAPVTVAHHGVDHERFTTATGIDAALDRALLARHGIDPPFVGFVGTIEPRKDLPTLIEAFRHVVASNSGLRLVLAGGDGWGATAVRHAVAASGVATHIVRPGYLPDDAVAALYRQAAVVAYPSLAEGFGLPALEALACGAPLVTARGTAMDEFVGDAALTFEPGDAVALAGALRAALDPATAQALRERGPRQAARYTWSASAEQHRAGYESALHASVAA